MNKINIFIKELKAKYYMFQFERWLGKYELSKYSNYPVYGYEVPKQKCIEYLILIRSIYPGFLLGYNNF